MHSNFSFFFCNIFFPFVLMPICVFEEGKYVFITHNYKYSLLTSHIYQK